LLGRLRSPSRIGKRLVRRGDTVENIVADFSLLLGFEEIVRVECPAGRVSARQHPGDLAGKILRLECLDPAGGAAAGEQFPPAVLNPHAEWRQKAQSRYDDPPHPDTLPARRGAKRAVGRLTGQAAA